MGLHEAVIEKVTWQSVQTQLADQGGKTIRAARRPAKRLLDGILFDSKSRLMRTTYASKSLRNDGTHRTKRYWYYTSSLHGSEDSCGVERLPAKELERVILDGLRDQVSDARWLADQMNADGCKPALVADILRALDQGKVSFDMSDDTASDQILPKNRNQN